MTSMTRLSNTITEVNTYLDLVQGVGHDCNQQVKQDDHIDEYLTGLFTEENTITDENTYLDFVKGVGHDCNQQHKQDDI